MSKRKIRKLRHRTDQKPILTFKQLTQMGNMRAKLMRGDITPEQIPAWMMGESGQATPAEQEFFGDPAEHAEHVHDEHCDHNHGDK